MQPDSSDGLAAHVGPPALLERLTFFSDAVFAIAMTLLIIEIHVPHLPHGADSAAHVRALAELFPSFTGFFVSFAVIGAFWAGHHRAFGLACHYAPGLVLPNLAMLCAIVLMPFATAYMSGNYGEVVPTVLYNALLLATGLLNLFLIRKVTGRPYAGSDADPVQLAAVRARGWGVICGALLALVTSFVAPIYAQPVLITIPLFARLAIALALRSSPHAPEARDA
ncbi:TMEM175 family protein [Sphingosinicella sp. BN140058]|uniref:TMEM175 family protein n=1 Tax=Sphingosinicella sp. BN140058 TaxID=1892855 RepID=UPI0010123AE4|nr:TMEM175 family protein [Sphingosinicella sp. BN140058]QAY75944.1 DUF1211 domain-containing protein [Sphingosinicella sp. BN140058]